MKKVMRRLTEQNLHNIIKESINMVLERKDKNHLCNYIEDIISTREIDAYPIREYCNETQMVMAVERQEDAREMANIMQKIGYQYKSSSNKGNTLLMVFAKR